MIMPGLQNPHWLPLNLDNLDWGQTMSDFYLFFKSHLERVKSILLIPKRLHSGNLPSITGEYRNKALEKLDIRWLDLSIFLTELTALVFDSPEPGSLTVTVTVQAPQPPCPQLNLVPVRCSFSLMNLTSLVSTPTSGPTMFNFPLTVNLICPFAEMSDCMFPIF